MKIIKFEEPWGGCGVFLESLEDIEKFMNALNNPKPEGKKNSTVNGGE